MKYLGGKHQNGKYISEVLKKVSKQENLTHYLEPFCGSLGVLKHMTDMKTCIGSDIHSDIIQLWKDVKENKFKPPKQVSNTFWNKVKNLPSPSALKAFVGFGCSFGGVYFVGNAQKYANTSNRNFCKEAIHSIEKIKPFISKPNVKFYCGKYQKLKPKNKLIYCDPPYQNTTTYKGIDSFNSSEFWDIMRKWSNNNIVVISEESSPKDFICIWEKEKRRTLVKTCDGRFYSKEKLFVHKSHVNKIKKALKLKMHPDKVRCNTILQHRK